MKALRGLVVVAAVAVVAACDTGPATPKEPAPRRPDIQEHVVTMRTSDFEVEADGAFATAGYTVDALTAEIIGDGEVHAYVETVEDVWRPLPDVLTTTGGTYTITAAFGEGVVIVQVDGPFVTRAVVDVFMPARLRIVMDAGKAG